MNQRDMTREQLEDALRLAQGEAEQYRREAMAYRWLLKAWQPFRLFKSNLPALSISKTLVGDNVLESIEKEIADESKRAQITEVAEQIK